MQRQALEGPVGGISSTSDSPDQILALEKQIAGLKSEIQVPFCIYVVVFNHSLYVFDSPNQLLPAARSLVEEARSRTVS